MQDGILVAVDCWIDTSCEDVLMVLGKDAGGNDVAVIRGFSWIDVDDAYYAGGAGFESDAAGGVEAV